jgi:two-component system sensor histidine kinase KdpD
MEFDLKPHALRGIIERAVKFTHALSMASGVDVEIEPSTLHDIAMVDARRAERVFVNLMTNSIRFSPRGGKILWRLAHETLCLHNADFCVPALRITIEDEGAGIPPHQLEDIFEPFVQGAQPRKPGSGSGLGLTICRRLLTAFYGTIHAANRPQGGAIFSVTLPLHFPTTH